MPIINRPNQHFDATLYTGTGSAQAIVNAAGFRPDLVWQKPRSEIASNRLVDSVRGVNNVIYSNQAAAESAETNTLTSFNLNGFTGGGSNAVSSGQTAIAWQWKAGEGATTVNTSGSISSNVSVNTTAGFSIVSYTGNGTNGATVGHGLGVTPRIIICKERGNTGSGVWPVKFPGATATQYLLLNSTAVAVTTNNYFTANPNASVFYVGNSDTNRSGSGQIAYCWAEVEGYSSFGSYTGNGSTNGPFIYTGFRPRFILVKNTQGVSNWRIVDTSRSTYNQTIGMLEPSSTAAEYTDSGNSDYDIVSNGFKIRNTGGMNGNNQTHIYMAFAESPFKFSNAR